MSEYYTYVTLLAFLVQKDHAEKQVVFARKQQKSLLHQLMSKIIVPDSHSLIF